MMTRTEFMTELAIRLEPLPENDRWDALQFYEEYFDDAGRDKEQDVIAELKSPAALAARIIGSPGVFPPRSEPAVDAAAAEAPNQPFAGQTAGQTQKQSPFSQTFTQQDPFEQTTEQTKEQPSFSQPFDQQNPFEQNAGPDYEQPGYDQFGSEAAWEEPPHHRSAAFWVLLAVLSPIWLSLLLGVIIAAFSIFITVASLLFAFAVTALALMISGLICLPVGFIHLFSDPLNGVFTFSIGLVCAGIALMLAPGILWLIRRTVPAMARGLKKMFQAIVRFFRG